MRLEEFRVYKEAMVLGEEVWEIVVSWDIFGKDIM